MPDRDIFTQHLPVGWWHAGRSVYAGADDEVMVKHIINSLCTFLDGCPCIDEIADLIVRAFESGFSEASHREAVGGLARVRRTSMDRRMAHIVAAARGFLAECPQDLLECQEGGESRVMVTSQILARLAIAQVSCSEYFLCQVAESQGADLRTILDRRHHALDVLQSSPHLMKLTKEALSKSGHVPLKRPKVAVPQLPQEELLYSPISS